MKSSFVALALMTLAFLPGCEKEKIPEPAAATPPATAAAAPAPPTAAPAATAALAAENIPVAADFEDEAEKSITKANYRAELDSLEAEIK
jgi:hypothetical protein